MIDAYQLIVAHVMSIGLIASAGFGAVALHREFKKDGRTWQFALSLFLVFVAGTALLGYAHFVEYLMN